MDRNSISGTDRTKNMKLAFCKRRRRTVHGHVSKGAIKRLARRGGVKRLSGLIYDEIRSMLKTYLESLIKDTVIYCDYSHRKTIMAKDVVQAIRRRGERLYGFDDSPNPNVIRTTIVLTDTPDESIPSTLESTPATESNVIDSEALKRNRARVSERFSNVLNDSDETQSDIVLPVKRIRNSAPISENLEGIEESAKSDSDVSDSLISPSKSSELLVEENRKSSNSNTFMKNSKLFQSRLTANEDASNSDYLESTEENNSLAPESESRRSFYVAENVSRDAEVHNQDPVPSTSNSGANKNDKRMPLNVRRRELFSHARSTAQPVENSSKATIKADKLSSSAVYSDDSDDFLDNLEFLVKEKRYNSRKSKPDAKDEESIERRVLNRSNSDDVAKEDELNVKTPKETTRNSKVVREGLAEYGESVETDSNDQDILVIWEKKPRNYTGNETKMEK